MKMGKPYFHIEILTKAPCSNQSMRFLELLHLPENNTVLLKISY